MKFYRAVFYYDKECEANLDDDFSLKIKFSLKQIQSQELNFVTNR